MLYIIIEYVGKVGNLYRCIQIKFKNESLRIEKFTFMAVFYVTDTNASS